MEEEEDPCGHRLVDPTPLLQSPTRSFGIHISSLISRATSRRVLRQPSMLVRETAALQLEERQADWTYSRPVVFLDVIWNLAFVILTVAVLGSTARERPSTPLRVWNAVYAMQCLLHVGLVYLEYRRRSRRRAEDEDEEEGLVESRSSVPKRLESLNTMVSFLWWIIGFYWIIVGGQALLQDAPRLYWLTAMFLAFDVFFAVFCIALACVMGIALCCCLPCIIAFLYAVAGQEGASEADISILPRFRFRQVNQEEKFDLENQQAVAPTVTELTRDSIDEIALSPDDSECCICLSQYEDGAELHSLPCNHHFHSGCIVKWLRINATCPLCKFNIIQAREQV
ncbi:hypothetical protein MRB53_008196 [Persea americana]|uniref:Uncharacterized protein n=1 Tax=Persea americana TaxID=3435 RepID=A0ACC2MLG5_PERAE|nr:hypothetical protein MRB53_008196 [Persea americana]|eukprot:TRINITY_DN3836_c0_g1_i1.p1 TRINITY_DN3836_c0_g1~~TRINITY_DN3836_c0_g1_i1.p1  ORF type:complete len:340 (-),score=43.58 TRINITY_DN3836_c0_g1_i1:259-1278(-)